MRRLHDAPVSLFDPRRFLDRDECERLADRVIGMARGGGITALRLVSTWTGSARWGRNRVAVASDQRDNREVWVFRGVAGAGAFSTTNQIDDASLGAAVRNCERLLRLHRGDPDAKIEPAVRFPIPQTTIWSDASYDADAALRGRVVRDLVAPAEGAGLLSAGYLAVTATGSAYATSNGLRLYAESTDTQCSVTVRDPRGTASGWAGLSTYDWAKLDTTTLGARALDKCQRSRDPVGIEPGRYTVILEPQAVADLVSFIVDALPREPAEEGHGPFAADRGFSKLGRKIVDERVTIGHDPADPMLGVVPFDLFGQPVVPVNWIERGVLRGLSYDRELYALPELNRNMALPNSGSFRMSGGSTSIDEMIATTKRGLLVTRFSNNWIVDDASLLCNGTTRDGLWLVENGKITKAVKNLRYTESPLFVLNNIEQMGVPVPVLRPGRPAVVPPLRARDFSFTSLVDAI